MDFAGFVAYDPYSTFLDPAAEHFVDVRGKRGRLVRENADLGSLWILARDAYVALPLCESRDEFAERIGLFQEHVASVKHDLRGVLKAGRMGLPHDLDSHVARAWLERLPMHDLMKLGWRFTGAIDEADARTDFEIHDIFGEAFLFVCLHEVDAALLAMSADGQGAVSSALNASEAYNLAMEILRYKEQVKKGKREMARRGAIARVAKSKKTSAKEDVHTWWSKWQGDPSLYKSKRAFADAMRDKHPELESEEAIKRWTRQWEKEQCE
ncbi:hypothetical protein OH764_00680 [Burkholderia sp. M6-3]